jgi:hypothetical protein
MRTFILVRVASDQEYLSWGMNEANFRLTPRLNTLAVIEFSLNFCKLCSSLVKYMDPEPSQIDLKIDIRNAFFGESKLFLIPHPVSTNWFSFSDDKRPAPESSTKRQIRVPTEQLKSRPDVVAFLLVRQIFLWFGVAAEMIPYVSAEGNLKFVDEDKIRNSRSS